MCGFARIRCPDCEEERLLYFSCKPRGFCPSCHAKRREEWGECMRKAGVDPSHPQIIEEEALFVPSSGWAGVRLDRGDPQGRRGRSAALSLLRRSDAHHPFIEDHKAIDKIIKHLKLSFIAERPPPPQVLHQELLIASEERGEYF
jgi:hypothetical protein